MERKGVVADPSSAILALSAEHMVKLTGLTMRQLAYWDATGFFKPEYAADNRRSPHSRVYSFSRLLKNLLSRRGCIGFDILCDRHPLGE